MRKITHNQYGDTIVEVMIAIAVASSVLGVTFATMNRNLRITRASQERTEASKLVQGQIEAIKARHDAGKIENDTNFCITTDLNSISLPPTTPNVDLATDDFKVYEDAGCVSANIYHYAIKEMGPDVYRFYVRWNRIGGSTRDELVMVYKL